MLFANYSICQTVYVETGNQGGTGATLAIALGAATTGSSHKIKVSLIECSNVNRAPAGCVQYFTGTSGNIMSYNFLGGQLLHNQFYSNCVRQETGYCSFELREAGTTTPDPFSIDTGIATTETACIAADGYVSVPKYIRTSLLLFSFDFVKRQYQTPYL